MRPPPSTKARTTSAHASRATVSLPTLNVIHVPRPTTGIASPVDGIVRVGAGDDRPWASNGRITAKAVVPIPLPSSRLRVKPMAVLHAGAMTRMLLRRGDEVRWTRFDYGRFAMRRLFNVVPGLLIGATLLASSSGLASDDAWKRLEAGGRGVLVRHTITTAVVGDPPGMGLDDCATQRNLTDQGRAHARAIGAAFRSRSLKPERVLSSPWCRCIETAQLAFGGSQTEAALSNLFGRSENRDRQVEALRAVIAAHRSSGNLVLITH